MGTRSLTHIYDDNQLLVTIYRQMDGYPTGMGADLKTILSSFTLVNGISLAVSQKVANGPGCLAAQLIKELKDGAGSIYIYPPGSSDCWEEYVYHVYLTDGHIRLKVEDTYQGGHVLYDGSLSDFDPDKCEAA